ncbi:MAG TPA: MFS transporter [Acidimicrobiales bacterium]|nr:MFS transporter [Acidimicrobiales bacterium]
MSDPGGSRESVNLRLYVWQRVTAGALFWLPTSFLFFLSHHGLESTLRLASVYFLAVVVFEVPSGWLSDHVGRVGILRLAALSWVVAHGLYLAAGDSFAVVAGAQVMLALGFASKSGTDTTLLFDTLENLGRVAEFERLEARAAGSAFAATAVAVVAGGALGFVDLRLPFAASLAVAVLQFAGTLRMVEPRSHRPDHLIGNSGAWRIRPVLAYLRRPVLLWLFVFLTLQQPLEGMALDLIQPWLTRLLGSSFTEVGSAPLLSGALMAVISVVGALTARAVPALRRRLGATRALMALAGLETGIVLAMALTASPLILPLLALRSTQAAAAPVLVSTRVAPLLERHHRATFLSLGSLSGRLLYGLVLLGLGTRNDFDSVLGLAAVIALSSLALLVATSPLASPRPGEAGS